MVQNLPIKAFSDFWKFYTTEKFTGTKIISFEEHTVVRDYTLGIFYDGMEHDYTREIINSLNRFGHEIDVIEIWSKHIFPKYSDDEQFELAYYFLEVPFYFCLNQPQAIRDRIIYIATHLCHQANLFIEIPGYKDSLPAEIKINMKELKKRVSEWTVAGKILAALNKIASAEYKEATFNFRNMAHHRVPPSLEYGHTNYIKRFECRESSFEFTTIENGIEVKKTKKTGGVSYGFGGIPPLKAVKILIELKKQHELLINAFVAYWEMILEHQNHKKLKMKI